MRLGDRIAAFFGNLGDLDNSWDVWASLGDFLDSILILKQNNEEIYYISHDIFKILIMFLFTSGSEYTLL